ncbi:unnamed protein product [Cyprideis torosa]|uniref:Uncharacterized protein n=1 Tax=Cyprideis torosa TaxID=163714 RepID=A0A7R8ZRV7_9CRUS|nr:unnamed protein product [Cyprideis torosa]CAG0894891.1 unnamed protein product [Cyprideis torosa]
MDIGILKVKGKKIILRLIHLQRGKASEGRCLLILSSRLMKALYIRKRNVFVLLSFLGLLLFFFAYIADERTETSTSSLGNKECPVRHLGHIDDHEGVEVEDALLDANSFKAERDLQHSLHEHAHRGKVLAVPCQPLSASRVPGSNRVVHHCCCAGEDDLAQWMFKKVRILCWVATHPGNLQKKAVHVLRTWGKR